MDTIRSLLAVKPTSKPTSPSTAASTAAADDTPADDASSTSARNAVQALQSKYAAQTARLQDIHKAVRPINMTKLYDLKQKEWEEWCAKLPGNTDGTWVTEDKLCLFLEQVVIGRESRGSGYQKRKEKRKEVWKESERAKKRARSGKGAAAAVKGKGRRKRRRRSGMRRLWNPNSVRPSAGRPSMPTSLLLLNSTRGSMPATAYHRYHCKARSCRQ